MGLGLRVFGGCSVPGQCLNRLHRTPLGSGVWGDHTHLHGPQQGRDMLCLERLRLGRWGPRVRACSLLQALPLSVGDSIDMWFWAFSRRLVSPAAGHGGSAALNA